MATQQVESTLTKTLAILQITTTKTHWNPSPEPETQTTEKTKFLPKDSKTCDQKTHTPPQTEKSQATTTVNWARVAMTRITKDNKIGTKTIKNIQMM